VRVGEQKKWGKVEICGAQQVPDGEVLPGHFTRTVHTHLGSRSGQSCCKEGGQHELCTAPAMVKKCVSPAGGVRGWCGMGRDSRPAVGGQRRWERSHSEQSCVARDSEQRSWQVALCHVYSWHVGPNGRWSPADSRARRVTCEPTTEEGELLTSGP
jgi:hypothetical protein